MSHGPPTKGAPLLSRLAGQARRTRVLVAVGVVALVLAASLGWLTWRDLAGPDEATATSAPVETERTVSRRGGFAVAVPSDMEVRRRGRTLQLTGADPQLVVDIGPAPSRRLAPAHRSILRTVGRGYARVRVIGRERAEVDGRHSLTTSGTARNEADVPVRFVVITVAARPRPYTLVAFTARHSAPAEVLPRLNAVVDGFEVLPR